MKKVFIVILLAAFATGCVTTATTAEPATTKAAPAPAKKAEKAKPVPLTDKQRIAQLEYEIARIALVQSGVFKRFQKAEKAWIAVNPNKKKAKPKKK